MNIVHIVDYIQPKLGYQEYFLAKEHSRMGHTVTVVTSDRYGNFPDYDNTIYPVLGDRIVGAGQWQCDGFKIIRLKTDLEIGAKVWLRGLSMAIQNLKPDVVICHGMTNLYALQVAAMKKKLRFRLIYDDHTLPAIADSGRLRGLFYRLFDFAGIVRNADKIIGIADECIEVIVEKYKVPREMVQMIPLGADTEHFVFNEKLRADFRKQFGISDDKIVITYTGRMNLDKAPHNIIIAVDNIRNRLTKNVVLMFVGNMEENYKNVFETHRRVVKDFANVITIPAVENAELVRVYSASDICAWPMQATASTIEALSCGLPVICVDVVSERCKNQNGIAVKAGDIGGLSKAILKLVNNDGLRTAMGRRSRDLAEKELSWKIIAARFLEE